MKKIIPSKQFHAEAKKLRGKIVVADNQPPPEKQEDCDNCTVRPGGKFYVNSTMKPTCNKCGRDLSVMPHQDEEKEMRITMELNDDTTEFPPISTETIRMKVLPHQDEEMDWEEEFDRKFVCSTTPHMPCEHVFPEDNAYGVKAFIKSLLAKDRQQLREKVERAKGKIKKHCFVHKKNFVLCSLCREYEVKRNIYADILAILEGEK